MLFNFTFEGNIAKQPKLQFAQNGTPVCNLVVMRTARYQREGRWVDGRTVAIDVSCWRDLAERAVELNVGDTVIVEISDDLHAEAFNGRIYLRATARTLALSMRWHGATSHRPARTTSEETTEEATEVAAAGGYDTGASHGYSSPDADSGATSARPARTTKAPADIRTARAARTATTRTTTRATAKS